MARGWRGSICQVGRPASSKRSRRSRRKALAATLVGRLVAADELAHQRRAAVDRVDARHAVATRLSPYQYSVSRPARLRRCDRGPQGQLVVRCTGTAPGTPPSRSRGAAARSVDLGDRLAVEEDQAGQRVSVRDALVVRHVGGLDQRQPADRASRAVQLR